MRPGTNEKVNMNDDNARAEITRRREEVGLYENGEEEFRHTKIYEHLKQYKLPLVMIILNLSCYANTEMSQ